jgi:CheY-like chemotaxis protein
MGVERNDVTTPPADLDGWQVRAHRCAVRCLIVDDSPNFVGAARSHLDSEEVTIVGEASTGADALRLADELRPDVILLDVNLGDESGFQIVEQLHWDVRARRIPVIMISTYAEQDIAEIIAASPAVGYV